LSNIDDLPEEKTEVIYGAENIVNATLEQWSKLQHYVDMYIDFYGPSMFVIPNHPVTFAYRKFYQLEASRFALLVGFDNICPL
jgi:hypothetical protein